MLTPLKAEDNNLIRIDHGESEQVSSYPTGTSPLYSGEVLSGQTGEGLPRRMDTEVESRALTVDLNNR